MRLYPWSIPLALLAFAMTAPGVATAEEPPRPVQPAGAWERIEKPLLWNFGNMYQPCVREIPGDAYPYKMWFFGWAVEDCNPGFDGCDAIFMARSKNLTDWEVYAGDKGWDTKMEPAAWVPVICADHKFYDEYHNGDPSVVYKDGRYYMAHGATSNILPDSVKGHPERTLLCIMGAESDDGIHWTKTEQPLLIESPEARNPKSDEGWIGNFLRPSLMWDQGKWRLWFDYWHYAKGVCMGYAENTGEFGAKGGFQIKHDLNEPLIANWPNPDVIKIGERYFAFGDPLGYPQAKQDENYMWTGRQLCEAVSNDGLKWDVVGYIAPDPDAAACHVPEAFTATVDGKPWLYLFYATQRGGKDKDGVFNYRYDRIKMMRQSQPK